MIGSLKIESTVNYEYFQMQLSRGVLIKRCSENIQQIYKRTPMPKCDFNKVAKQIEIALQHECSPVHLLHIFSRNTSGWLLLYF